MLKDISNDANKDVLSRHSEKLALVCPSINTPKAISIRVKSLQICNNFLSATALISNIEDRRIDVRDANCLHVFEQGLLAMSVQLHALLWALLAMSVQLL